MVTTLDATPAPRELPIVGGHPALDFANTVDDPDGPACYDHAGTYEELVGWSARIGVLKPDQAMELLAAAQEQPRAGSAALRRAHALRNILIKTFTGVSMINSGAASAAGASNGRGRIHQTESAADLQSEGAQHRLPGGAVRGDRVPGLERDQQRR